ncbi:hypothetical protein ASPSYDRAFT_139843 [Aspergillus sydowii CBS 593.65]|uniref:Type 1 phosphatases regulator n=1 Tax=Aspergillus sydowii CBS 593.65 TaxID=1036612 RepID=A0A1L9TV09_9EURO|nr:uncharacterized protein ASPSYDRAFT_139843 [Aspergillus sydowii CBS 593.65]OJJ63245.1 hypothetical protein ASPSYDRAFT_139843 [Aspergillus sydowii CBS 593.65]
MSHGRQLTSQNPTSNSRVSSISRVQDNTSNIQVTGTLRLRAEDDASDARDETPTRHIRWRQDVVDNEGMGKKSSKGTNRDTPQPMTGLLEKVVQNQNPRNQNHPIRTATGLGLRSLRRTADGITMTRAVPRSHRKELEPPVSMAATARNANEESLVQMPTKRCQNIRRAEFY